MPSDAQRLLNRIGIVPRPDYSTVAQTYPLRSQSDLERLRHEAYDPDTGGPGSAAYKQLMHAYQTGLTDNLPDERYASGIPMLAEHQAQLAVEHQDRNTSMLIRWPAHLSGYQINGRNLVDMPVEEARNEISIAIAESEPAYRQELIGIQRMLDDADHSSQGIEYTAPDDLLEYNAPSDSVTDPYQIHRSNTIGRHNEQLQTRANQGDAAAGLALGISHDAMQYTPPTLEH